MKKKALLTAALVLGLPLAPSVGAQASPPVQVAPQEVQPQVSSFLEAYDRQRQERVQAAHLLLKGDVHHNILGEASGEARGHAGLLARPFTKGWVVVNPTTQDKDASEVLLHLGESTAPFTVGAEDAVFVKTVRD